MPYILISTAIRLENGPTIVGDEFSDPNVMEYLDAEPCKPLGNNFIEYRSQDPPRVVLNKLEKLNYRVVAMTGVGQTCAWTLHKNICDQLESTSINGNISNSNSSISTSNNSSASSVSERRNDVFT